MSSLNSYAKFSNCDMPTEQICANQHNWVATCIPVLIFVQQIMELVPLICSKFHALLILTSLYCQNDLVHGWGLDFALRKCVEVSLITLLLFLAILFHGFNLLLLCVISSTASSWEDWGHRFAVDSTSRNSFTREPGKIWLFIYVFLKRWLQQFFNYVVLDRVKARMERHRWSG